MLGLSKKSFREKVMKFPIKPNITIVLLFAVILSPSFVWGQNSEESEMFEVANEHFSNGKYNEAITIYDKILETYPNNISTLKMKGIAQSNLGNHIDSLKQFFTILQYKPDDVIALAGMGIGFGNLGEYHESKKYFDLALEKKPDSFVIKNYKNFVEEILSKYPYTPTSKPQPNDPIVIPDWIKSVAKWWSQGQIPDVEFVKLLQFLIENKIMVVDLTSQSFNANHIPDWVRDNARWWSEGKISNHEFAEGLEYMMKNGILKIDNQVILDEFQREKNYEFLVFEKYLGEIQTNIVKEKRYIEYPNPSGDVIKKFLRDYLKWNFEQEAKSAAGSFPDPTYEVIDDSYLIYYKVFVNQQPTGLPLDHVSTLKNSFDFWESQELIINERAAKVFFEVTERKQEANIWITWVVRNLGEGVLGNAHLGKGVVEVTLGDYNCDGSFQLYDVSTVEKIMTHELGHSIGLTHVADQNEIMYYSMTPNYAYCLLG